MATNADTDDFPEIEIEEEGATEVEVEEIDDTPEADKGRAPMPKEIVEELEKDELEAYDEGAKQRLKQLKKVWHDERREKERVQRENQEAIATAQRLFEENRKLKSTLSQGETTLLESFKRAAAFEVDAARREYREAHETGDTEKLLEAQEKLTEAQYRVQQLNGYTPSLQEEDEGVDLTPQVANPPRPDDKTMAWQERNSWYGSDTEMTASALGLHQKLITERGAQFAGTDEYWNVIDKTMKRRFPEYFEADETSKPVTPRTQKPTSVVAPASRSRSPKRIVLKQSQLAVAKKLGITPEQYAKELVKMENPQ